MIEPGTYRPPTPGRPTPVRADSLVPRQRPTPVSFKTATDFYQQWMLKHPFLSDFHSLAEYLHAGLLEGDPAVRSYVPQPFLLQVGRTFYPPDCYIVTDHAPPLVVELKPLGEMDEALRIPVVAYLETHNMRFEVRSNESVFERRQEALNWLEIVHILHLAQNLETQVAEAVVLERFAGQPEQAMGQIVDRGDRDATYGYEIALLRLLHRGQLRAKLDDRVLDWDTEFTCN